MLATLESIATPEKFYIEDLDTAIMQSADKKPQPSEVVKPASPEAVEPGTPGAVAP